MALEIAHVSLSCVYYIIEIHNMRRNVEEPQYHISSNFLNNFIFSFFTPYFTFHPSPLGMHIINHDN